MRRRSIPGACRGPVSPAPRRPGVSRAALSRGATRRETVRTAASAARRPRPRGTYAPRSRRTRRAPRARARRHSGTARRRMPPSSRRPALAHAPAPSGPRASWPPPAELEATAAPLPKRRRPIRPRLARRPVLVFHGGELLRRVEAAGLGEAAELGRQGKIVGHAAPRLAAGPGGLAAGLERHAARKELECAVLEIGTPRALRIYQRIRKRIRKRKSYGRGRKGGILKGGNPVRVSIGPCG